MPTLVLKLTPLQNPERYQALARALTDHTVQLLGKRREVTAVVIDDLPAARWHIGGASVAQPTALLEISITQGTNTEEEKAAFIAAAFAELQRRWRVMARWLRPAMWWCGSCPPATGAMAGARSRRADWCWLHELASA